MSCLFFYGVLGFHIKFLSHLVAVVSKQIVVKRFFVSGNGAPDRSCMSRKYSSNFGNGLLYVQST